MATADDIKKFLEEGYSLSEINEIIRDPAKMNALVNNHGAMKAGTYKAPTISPVWRQTARDPFSGGPIRQPFNGGKGAVTGSIGSRVANTAAGKQTGLAAGLSSALGKLQSSSIGKGIAAIVNGVQKDKAANEATRKRNEALQRVQKSLGQYDRILGTYQDAKAAGVGLPEDPGAGVLGAQEEFQQPTFTMKDFTDQANQTAASVYQPRYDAIDLAAKGAQEQYGRADQMTKGLYENLAKSIADTAAGVQQRYAQATADQAAATQGLQENIGNTYQQNNAQQVALMKQLGQEESAADVLTPNTQDQSWQQGQAAILGGAQQGAIQTQGQGQQDYMQNVKTAEQTQGVVSREGLINQLGQTLQGYDADRMNLASDRSASALDIANTLSNRDLQLQQMNYQGYTDAYGARQNQANAAQDAQAQAIAAQQAQYDRNAQWQQSRQDQSNLDRRYDLDVTKLNTDLVDSAARGRLDQARYELEAQQAGAQQNKPLASSPDPASNTIYQIADTLGGDQGTAQKYFNYAQQLANSGNEMALTGITAFVQEAGNQAASKGLNPSTAMRAAAAYWKNFAAGK